MWDYFDEHRVDENISDDRATMARFLVESGWSHELALNWEHLFPDNPKAASEKAIAELERLTAEELTTEGQCAICLAAYDANEDKRLIRMPCRHIFHQSCILPWLKLTNSCPFCRKELPSQDPLYEAFKKQEERLKTRAADIEELHNSMFS